MSRLQQTPNTFKRFHGCVAVVFGLLFHPSSYVPMHSVRVVDNKGRVMPNVCLTGQFQRESPRVCILIPTDTVAFLRLPWRGGTEWLFKNQESGGLMRSSRKLWEFGNLRGHGRLARNPLDPFAPTPYPNPNPPLVIYPLGFGLM